MVSKHVGVIRSCLDGTPQLESMAPRNCQPLQSLCHHTSYSLFHSPNLSICLHHKSHCQVYTSHLQRQTDRQAGRCGETSSQVDVLEAGVLSLPLCVKSVAFSFPKFLLSLSACHLQCKTDTRVPWGYTDTAQQIDDLTLSDWLAQTQTYTHKQYKVLYNSTG